MPSGIFRSLTDGEYQQLIDAVPLIAILIAGADGNINLKEKSGVRKLLRFVLIHSNMNLSQYTKS